MALGGLDFEKPILELENKIEELKKFSASEKIDISKEIKNLESKLEDTRKEIFSNLTPWQRVQLARHPRRPYVLDYVAALFTDFMELHGDRLFGDDKALIGGFAKFEGQTVLIIGQQKGRDTKEKMARNFGMPHPEGYRKALRLMKLAEKFDVPIITFIDTPGAYPGIDAEERGQASAIAYNLMEMAELRVPIIVFVIGEGGSGGALGIGVGDRICVLENSYYSVISPEGCAAILWKANSKAPEAAEVLKLTAQDLYKFKLIDEVVEEPLGGAHSDLEKTAENIKKSLKKFLAELKDISSEKLVKTRYEKYREMGQFQE